MNEFTYDANYYDVGIGGFHAASFPALREELARLTARVRFNSALDFGCGNGFYGRLLRDSIPLVDGVDKSGVIREHANRHYYDRVYVQDLGEAGWAGDRQYELLWSIEVIEHVRNYRAFLENAFRALKPGGYLFLSTTTYFWALFVLLIVYRRQTSASTLWEFTRGLLGSERHSSQFVTRFWKYFGGHYHGFSRAQLRRAARGAGFEVLELRHLHVQPVFPVSYLDQPYRGRHRWLVGAGVGVLRPLGRAINFLCRRLDLHAPNVVMIARKPA